jgi:hypothetical protein
VYSIVDPEAARAWHGSSCGKKIKKDLTSRITWEIKGVLTRKTKGKQNVKSC